MSYLERLRGTARTIFQIGKGGPNLKNNGGRIEARNAADAAFAIARGADPAGSDDLVTKRYADALASVLVVDQTATPAGNVYATLADASAAAKFVNGDVKYIFRGNQTIPAVAGGYDLRPNGSGLIFWEGSLNGNVTTAGGVTAVTWGPGAYVGQGFPAAVSRLKVLTDAAKAEPIIDAIAGNYRLELNAVFVVPGNATSPFVRGNGAAIVNVSAFAGTAYSAAAGPVFDCAHAATTFNYVGFDGVFTGSNVLRQSAGALNAQFLRQGSFSTTQLGAVIFLSVPYQKFSVAIGAGGVSAAVPAVVTASSVIICSLKTPAVGDTSTLYSALGPGRTPGNVSGALGSFVVSALITAGGVANALANGTVVDVTIDN